MSVQCDPEVPRGFYHRRCYQTYTHKKSLLCLQLQRQQEEEGCSTSRLSLSDEHRSLKRRPVLRSIEEKVDKQLCFMSESEGL